MAASINELYLKYVDNVGMSLEEDRYFQYLFEMVQAGENELHQTNQVLHKVVDEEWINIIEDTLDSINTIIDKPRRFVTSSEEIVPVALAKKISADSVKHLSQHTEFISASDDGEIHPSKILNVTTEETYDLYENRFIYHLIQRLIAFVDKRTDVIFWSTGDEKVSTFRMQSKIDDAYEDIEYKLEMKVKNKQSFAENDEDNMDIFMRIDRIRRLVTALKQSSFCSLMAGCAKVRSPIQRTNLMMKDPHYRKCYALWQFLERYDSVGYKIDVQETAVEFDEEYLIQMYTNLITNYTVFKTLTEHDIRDIDQHPLEKRQKIEPKFIKEIREEFVDDYNLPDVEIRRVFVEEVTQAQLDAEAKLEEESRLRQAAENAVRQVSTEKHIVESQLEDTFAQLNSVIAQKEAVDKKLDNMLLELKSKEEAAAHIRHRLEDKIKEISKEAELEVTNRKALQEQLNNTVIAANKKLEETKAEADALLEETKAEANARIAESDARLEEANTRYNDEKLAKNKLQEEYDGYKAQISSKINDYRAETQNRIAEQEYEIARMRQALKEAEKAVKAAEKHAAEAEKSRDKAIAKAEGSSLSKYILDRLKGRENRND